MNLYCNDGTAGLSYNGPAVLTLSALLVAALLGSHESSIQPQESWPGTCGIEVSACSDIPRSMLLPPFLATQTHI